MQNYSQNQEQQAILDYFGGALGTFLDIGAYHPTDLSNTRALYEHGWRGVFIEPNPAQLPLFEAAYGSDEKIQTFPLCIGLKNEEIDFLVSSGGNIPWGDAVSTTEPGWTAVWEKAGVKFESIKRDMVTIPELLTRPKFKKFDFVSIDTEGNVLDILLQINPQELGTKLICAEWNRKDFAQFDQYFRRWGMTERYRSAENLIYGI